MAKQCNENGSEIHKVIILRTWKGDLVGRFKLPASPDDEWPRYVKYLGTLFQYDDKACYIVRSLIRAYNEVGGPTVEMVDE